jgi:exodeoxyribonuclease VII small subunit
MSDNSKYKDNINSIPSMSFEDAIKELEKIVNRIDSGSESLSQVTESFEYGVLLKQHCQKLLNETKLKIDKITNFESHAEESFENKPVV